MGEMKNAQESLVREPEGKTGDLSTEGRILKWMLEKIWGIWCGLDSVAG